jgi:hypothetical protein
MKGVRDDECVAEQAALGNQSIRSDYLVFEPLMADPDPFVALWLMITQASSASQGTAQTMGNPQYESYMGLGPRRIAHWEHWSNPDTATHITGIDFYEHPRSCMLRLNEIYPFLHLGAPERDDPLPRPEAQQDLGKGRWGHAYRDHWQQEVAGNRFASREEMLRFSPLAQGDFTGWQVVVDGDFSSEEVIYQRYRAYYPEAWGDRAPPGSPASVGFYNTMFMWPLLVFGYEPFLAICLEPDFARVMDEFAEINRRVFRAFARLPVNFVVCHDDIVLASGPVCSPAWMHQYIFPRYEEFWGILKRAGKEVLFMADGCMDAFADDVMACGARGIISEPFTDYKAIARKYENCFIAGEGDARILMRNDPAEIRTMVEEMVETAGMSSGYMMCIGNHIPFNVPGEAVKRYLDLSAELGYR